MELALNNKTFVVGGASSGLGRAVAEQLVAEGARVLLVARNEDAIQEAARELGDRKAANVLQTAPDLYTSANPGCLVQVSQALGRAGKRLPALHPVELLDASIRGLDASRLLARARR